MSKPKAKSRTLHSWEAVDQVLAELAQLDPAHRKLAARRDEAIARLSARYDEKLAPAAAEIAGLGAAVGEFVLTHSGDLSPDGDRRSRDLSHGRVGLYLSPPRLATIGRLKWDTVLERIRELPAHLRHRFLRHPDPKLDKDELQAAIRDCDISEEQRRALGVDIRQDEIAYYELS